MRGNSKDLLKDRERSASHSDKSRSFRKEELNENSKYSINLNNLKEKEKENKINEEQRKKLLYEEKVKLFNINKQRLALIAEKKLKERNYIDILKEKKQNEEIYNYLKSKQKIKNKNNSAKIINRKLNKKRKNQ